MRRNSSALVLILVFSLIIKNALSQTTTVFTNSTPITITTGAAASVYPSTINVSGLTGVITNLTITISGFTHARPDDVDMLLVGPSGQAFTFLSDAGGTTALSPVTNITITFSDGGASHLPDGATLLTGTSRPTNHGTTQDLFSESRLPVLFAFCTRVKMILTCSVILPGSHALSFCTR